MLTTAIVVTFLLLFSILMLTISGGLRYLEAERTKKVENQLSHFREGTPDDRRVRIILDKKTGVADEKPSWFDSLPAVKWLAKRIQQAGLSWSVGRLLTLMIAGAIIGAFGGSRVMIPFYREVFIVGLAALGAAIPYWYVSYKRTKRIGEFEEQFPEALDFMARSLRAGHAFSVSLEMMADESPEPMRTEFRQVFNEQNLGATMESALHGLAERVPLIDVGFFVSAVLIQRSTGGNLSEILTNLAHVIRERFRLKGQVRAISAHGRLTATILTVLPVVTAVILMIIAPEYLARLPEDEHGKYILLGAILAQFLGYYIMKRIINIRV